MRAKVFHASLTRISDLGEVAYEVGALPRSEWATGDYVLVRALDRSPGVEPAELTTGRKVHLLRDDLLVGALGKRAATLEAVGDWEAVEEDGRMELMTGGGMLGRVTSISRFIAPLTPMSYEGHVLRGGHKVTMDDFVAEVEGRELETPVVLIIGTSMSSGKTTSAKRIIRILKDGGRSVVGAKLTGAGQYRDILTMQDAGADHILDFVDQGLPSTVVPPEEYRKRLRALLSRMEALQADVIVAEAGASPLEPYNGGVAVEELADSIRCTVLCASDPYAIVGITTAFDRLPDVVSGPCANTEAGRQLATRLTGIPALDVHDPGSIPTLRDIVESCLARRG